MVKLGLTLGDYLPRLTALLVKSCRRATVPRRHEKGKGMDGGEHKHQGAQEQAQVQAVEHRQQQQQGQEKTPAEKPQQTKEQLQQNQQHAQPRQRAPSHGSIVPLRVVVLVTSTGGNAKVEAEQRRCRDVLVAKNLAFQELDGADLINKEKRDFLFLLSSHKSYPQVFLESQGNIFKYVGTWPDVQEMLDSCEIPADILAQHPEIKTFDRVFANVPRGTKPVHSLSAVW